MRTEKLVTVLSSFPTKFQPQAPQTKPPPPAHVTGRPSPAPSLGSDGLRGQTLLGNKPPGRNRGGGQRGCPSPSPAPPHTPHRRPSDGQPHEPGPESETRAQLPPQPTQPAHHPPDRPSLGFIGNANIVSPNGLGLRKPQVSFAKLSVLLGSCVIGGKFNPRVSDVLAHRSARQCVPASGARSLAVLPDSAGGGAAPTFGGDGRTGAIPVENHMTTKLRIHPQKVRGCAGSQVRIPNCRSQTLERTAWLRAPRQRSRKTQVRVFIPLWTGCATPVMGHLHLQGSETQFPHF